MALAGMTSFALTACGNDDGQVTQVTSPAGPGPAAASTIRILQAPQTVMSVARETVRFAVRATGANELTYQWLRNGVPIAGAIGPFLYVSLPTVGDSAASYAVRIDDGISTQTSTAASITLRTAPGLQPFAGTFGSLYVDGLGFDARFYGPSDLAADASGNVWVADRAIRKIDPQGRVSTVVDNSSTTFPQRDGPIADARAFSASAIALDPAGDPLYVDYAGLYRLTGLQRQDRLYGRSALCLPQAPGLPAPFYNPPDPSACQFGGVAIDAQGAIYLPVGPAVRKVSPTGVITTLAGGAAIGFADGTGSVAKMNVPTGIVVDGIGTVYVADTGNHVIRRITADGLVTTLAGRPSESGIRDGIGADARFVSPRGLALDPAGVLYIVDDGANNVRTLELATGRVVTILGAAMVEPASTVIGQG